MLHPEADLSSAKALSSPTASPDGEDYYAKLGVTIINATGTYTTLTAACMPPWHQSVCEDYLPTRHRAVMGTLRYSWLAAATERRFQSRWQALPSTLRL